MGTAQIGERNTCWIKTEYCLASGHNGVVVVAQRVSKTVEIQAEYQAGAGGLQRESVAVFAPADARRLAAALMKAADMAERGRK